VVGKADRQRFKAERLALKLYQPLLGMESNALVTGTYLDYVFTKIDEENRSMKFERSRS